MLMGLIAPALSSQTTAARTEIIAAAVRYVVDQLGSEWAHLSGPVLFDPRVLESRFMSHPAYENPIEVYELGAPRDPQVTGELLRLIPAQPGDVDLATVCATNDPGTCTLGGAVAIFAASDPVMRGDTAEALRLQQIELVRIEEKWRQASSSPDVHFTGPAELIRVQNAVETEALSASEIFTWFAVAPGPDARSTGDAPLRLRRILLGVEQTPSDAKARYRTGVFTDANPLHHLPWWNDTRELVLTKWPLVR